MKQFKVIQLIRRLPPQSIPFIKDFITSNTIVEANKMLLYILDGYKFGQSDHEIWTNTFPSIPFKKQQFANYCHHLLNGVEKAICLYSLKSQPLYHYDLLLPNLLNWDILDHFRFSQKKARKILQGEVDHDYYSLYKHRLDYMQFISLEKESSRKTDLNINEASDSLDEYYVLLKLRYLCAALNHQKISSSNYQINFILMMLPVIENSTLIKRPLIRNYILVYHMLNEIENDQKFQALKESLIIDRSLFSDSELNEIYIYPINFCIQKINMGQLRYRQELLNIYKSLPGFEEKSEEIISPWRFRNVIQLALMEHDYEWAEYFINHFSHRLLKEYRDNAVNYNLANLKFHQKKYDEVIPLLIHVTYQDINYALICKILLLKTYFDMNEIEAFHSLLESFRLYITRSRELTGVQRKQYLDLLSILRRLSKMEYANYETIEKFKTKIRNREIIADKGWILEQLDVL